jgi:hypothetical protein
MVNIYSVIVEGVDRPDCSSLATKFQMLKGRCRIILQVTWEKKQKKKIEVHPFSFVNVVGFSLLFLWCNMCCLKIDRCSVIAIQVHDELVLEVDPSVIKEAALLLQMSMENAALLLGIFLLFVVHILYILRICSFCILSHYLFFSSFACQTESGKNVGFFGTFPSYCA